MRNALRVLALAALCSVLAACPAKSVRTPPVGGTPVPSVGAPDLRGATVYAVNPTASEVNIQVFRGGTLARLGHNHVMTSKQVTGRVWLHRALERSGFELSFPVADIIVDDPAARAAAGTEFPGEIPASDREGTRKNMLRTEVLDAEHFPSITLRSVRIAGSQESPQVTAYITIKNVGREVSVPARVTLSSEQLTASGQFDIQQTDFGIEPFSIGLGALQVQDKLHIQFKLVANKT